MPELQDPCADDYLVAGVDEVGRGPLAGPVVAAAVILKGPVEGIRDSKKLTAERRNALFGKIQEHAYVSVAAASVREIDRLNILQASYLAMQRAVTRLPVRPDRILVDGKRGPDFGRPSQCIVGGDDLIPAISAASIIAKVVRDRLMHRLASRYPDFGWETNVGYPTVRHHQGLNAFGVTVHHRRSFAPVAALMPNLDRANPA
ncbi:MAG: ribonuclease HII [Pseudomonadota bacterium]